MTANGLHKLDYYSFGMIMPDRSYSATPDGYRFGFNGKEQDNEVSGSGNSYDYGFRIYNPRLGKFLSLDPLFKSYPWYTPYQFAGNMPISAIDLDGLEALVVTKSWSDEKYTKPVITIVIDETKDFGIYKVIDWNSGSEGLYVTPKIRTSKVMTGSISWVETESGGTVSESELTTALFAAVDHEISREKEKRGTTEVNSIDFENSIKVFDEEFTVSGTKTSTTTFTKLKSKTSVTISTSDAGNEKVLSLAKTLESQGYEVSVYQERSDYTGLQNLGTEEKPVGVSISYQVDQNWETIESTSTEIKKIESKTTGDVITNE